MNAKWCNGNHFRGKENFSEKQLSGQLYRNPSAHVPKWIDISKRIRHFQFNFLQVNNGQKNLCQKWNVNFIGSAVQTFNVCTVRRWCYRLSKIFRHCTQCTLPHTQIYWPIKCICNLNGCNRIHYRGHSPQTAATAIKELKGLNFDFVHGWIARRVWRKMNLDHVQESFLRICFHWSQYIYSNQHYRRESNDTLAKYSSSEYIFSNFLVRHSGRKDTTIHTKQYINCIPCWQRAKFIHSNFPPAKS